MSEANATCPECGSELPEGTPASQCPQCLIGLGLEASPRQSSVISDRSSVISNRRSLITLGAFGDYELLEEIARGGMGVVYKARQVSLDRLVAVKMILAGEFATQQFVQRFLTEAAAAAVLHHPNIVAIHEVGVHAGQHYFSMDFVDGPSLAALVGHQPLPARRAAQYLKTIAGAIHYAHEQGILHRDLKPSNVLIDASDQPRITDFGLAKRLEGETSLTLSGQMVGSPNFMPPEQATAKHGKVGRYSDVYSMGGILYHLLTARPPFQADSLEVIVSQVLTAEPVSPRLLNPTVPRDLETICLRCLEKEPARRYASAQLLADELGRFLEGKPIQARPVSAADKAWKWCRRQPVRAGLVTALILVFTLGLTGVLWQWRRADRNAQEEARQRLRAEENEYAADMKLAQLALMDNNVGLAVSLLNKHRPGFGVPASAGAAHKTASEQPDRLKAGLRTDLRPWEWRYLWQLCQGEELFTLHHYPDSIGAVAVSKDGEVLALQTGDEVALWDLITRRPLTAQPIAASSGLVFDPIGSLLAVGSRNARGEPGVDLWDVNAGKLVGTLTHPWPVRSLAFSPDGKLLATFDDKGTIALVEWASNHTLTNFTVPPPRRGGAGVVVFSPQGSRLAIGADYGRIRVLNWRTGAVLPIQTQTEDGVMALVFSPTAELLAAGFGFTSGVIGLWDSTSGEPRGQLTHHAGWISALAFTPDGRLLASASVDRTIRVWNVADQAELRCLRGHQDKVTALAFLPDGRTLVSGCANGSVCFWDVTATNRTLGHASLVISYGFAAATNLDVRGFSRGALDPKAVLRLGLAFTPDSHSFLTTDPAGGLGVWDARSAQRTEALPALGSNNWNVALSPGGRWLAVGDPTGKVNIWDWQARRLVARCEIPFEWCGLLRFAHSGRFLLATVVFNDERRAFKMWRTDDWQEVPFPEIQTRGIWSVALSPDDRLLAMGYGNGAVKLWDFPSGEHEIAVTNHKGAVTEVLFSPDGRMLASTSGDGQAKLWDVIARRELATLRGHWTSPWSAAFSSDGRRLATGGEDSKEAVRLWDIATRRELLTLQAEGHFFVQLSFSPDGNTLVAISLDGMAHLWRAPSWEEIVVAEKGQVTP